MAKIKSLILVLSLQLVLQISRIESKPDTGAFGAGGLETSHFPHLNHNESHYVLGSVPSIVPATTVERAETYSNGCYKLIIKEADITDIRRFIETAELVCPPGIDPSSDPILNEQLQQNGTLYHATPHHAPEFVDANIIHANGTHIAVLPPHSIAEHHPSNSSHSPVWAEVPNTATTDVLIISQKIGYYDNEKKSNGANNMYSVNYISILMTISIFYSFM